jgi:hypothetical protein
MQRRETQFRIPLVFHTNHTPAALNEYSMELRDSLHCLRSRSITYVDLYQLFSNIFADADEYQRVQWGEDHKQLPYLGAWVSSKDPFSDADKCVGWDGHHVGNYTFVLRSA